MRECSVCQSCFPDAIQTCDRDSAPTRITLPIEPLVNERYHLKKRVGTGSISIVYLAQDVRRGTNHAVKIILSEFVGHSSSFAQRFLLEARDALELAHPNVLAVTDSGLINALLPFLVTDFIKGKSLKEVLSSRKQLSPSEAFGYVVVIGKGLAAAHARGIVHGDLKPRNILIEENRPLNEALRIADFGLAVLKSGRIDGATEQKWSGVLRSPLYLAPEEWSEDEPNTRSDIYSLGVILYQMLAGEVPFKGKSSPAIMKAHLINPPPPLAERATGITADVESVVLRALEKEPDKRFQTIDSFVSEFQQALENVGVDERPLDLEQTIVLPRAAYSQKWTAGVEVDGDPVEEPDFAATIVPGAIKYELTDAEESVEYDDEANVPEQSEILPRSIQPLLLALGVVLVILLIGIGVYYSRMTQ
jgi:eukaryotic-like serine/threonine-protein kinase